MADGVVVPGIEIPPKISIAETTVEYAIEQANSEADRRRKNWGYAGGEIFRNDFPVLVVCQMMCRSLLIFSDVEGAVSRFGFSYAAWTLEGSYPAQQHGAALPAFHVASEAGDPAAQGSQSGWCCGAFYRARLGRRAAAA